MKNWGWWPSSKISWEFLFWLFCWKSVIWMYGYFRLALMTRVAVRTFLDTTFPRAAWQLGLCGIDRIFCAKYWSFGSSWNAVKNKIKTIFFAILFLDTAHVIGNWQIFAIFFPEKSRDKIKNVSRPKKLLMRPKNWSWFSFFSRKWQHVSQACRYCYSIL